LEDALNDTDTDMCEKTLKEFGSSKLCPTLKSVADKFTLNEKQRIAFFIVGNALLKSIRDQIVEENLISIEENPEKNSIPLRMYLGGEGGTGNSRVIKVLIYLSQSWGRPNAVQTIAPTGQAAVLTNGETAHSFLKLSNRNFKESSLSEEEKIRYRELVLLIYDEIGMSGKYEFAKSLKM
ncbi:MAG: hypothetical protein AAGH46_13035, partial [Bacteroidota bacterium]